MYRPYGRKRTGTLSPGPRDRAPDLPLPNRTGNRYRSGTGGPDEPNGPSVRFLNGTDRPRDPEKTFKPLPDPV